VEIKNYTTKFEDLFSTIVAETEDMKRNSAAIAAAAGGKIALETRTFNDTLGTNYSVLEAYLDSYFDSSQMVKDKLASLFTEAGEILSEANKSLSNVYALNAENASILAGFAEKIKNKFSTKAYTSKTKPETYNVGDLWNEVDDSGKIIGRYIATTGSNDTAGGFTRVYDGKLASITGASINIDAVEGTIDILAQNKIDIKSGGYLYLAADNTVDIVGNEVVNIGGTIVNIASLNKDGTNYSAGGINLISGAFTTNNNGVYNGTDTRILMNPSKIEMAGSSIEMYTGTGINDVASIKLDGESGVWIGSSKKITLFSGSTTNGATAEISYNHVYIGVASGTAVSSVEIVPEHILLATGTATNMSSANVTINETGSLLGLKLTKTSFGLAVNSGNNRGVIIIDGNGIIAGTGSTPETSGSFVKISGAGVDIGSTGKLYVNMDNFKL